MSPVGGIAVSRRDVAPRRECGRWSAQQLDAGLRYAHAIADAHLLIEEAGGKMEHLCKVTVYLTDVRHREAVYRTMGEYIKGVHPVSTGVVVTCLARPSWLVEIDATAVIPD